MKINWGTGIVIAIVGFIGFIMYFVIAMSTDDKYSHDLVTDKYYQKELEYQKEINATQKGVDLKENLKITKVKEGIEIKFPEDFQPKDIKGKVFLYRPSNKQLDFEIPISISKPYLLVPENRLLDGRWNITVQWSHKSTDYLYKKEFLF